MGNTLSGPERRMDAFCSAAEPEGRRDWLQGIPRLRRVLAEKLDSTRGVERRGAGFDHPRRRLPHVYSVASVTLRIKP